MTNGDKIRQMSNEEIGKICSRSCPTYPGYCKGCSCSKCWIDWLNKEADEK